MKQPSGNSRQTENTSDTFSFEEETVDISQLYDDLDDVDKGTTEVESLPTSLASEPMFSSLLRTATKKLWGTDPVMEDFVTHVAPNLSDLLGHVAAKGGDFAQERRDAGDIGVDRYGHDQSMRAHLINGLFPVLHVAHTLQRWDAPQLRDYDDTVRRVFIAGYVLHDWLKLPDVDAQLQQAGLNHAHVNAAQHLNLVEQIFLTWSSHLGLDKFLAPIGGTSAILHDLIFVACNTQIKWGTLRNLASLKKLSLPGVQLDLAEQLSRLADYLAYIGRNPRQAASDQALHREISTLSRQTARLVYHHVADVRGVVTNLIHNAALDARQNEYCVPILYAPSGVVYLRHVKDPFTHDPDALAEAVVQKVRRVAGRRLSISLTGFNRDGKGLKYANYYGLFFETMDMLDVSARAASKIIHPGKKPSAEKRYAKLRDNAWLDPDVDLDLPDDYRVDQMAEWCFVAEKIVRDLPGGGSVPKLLMEKMELNDIYDDFLQVPRDARTGGVSYHWYFAVGHYLKRNGGLDPTAWQERIEAFAWAIKAYLISQQKQEVDTHANDDGFNDLRAYVNQVLTFGPVEASATSIAAKEEMDLFALELKRYTNAKKRGQGTTSMCALCSSPFTVDKQEEAASLFAPQVYSNKMTLHGSSAIRDICSICSLEIMLRQILMNRSNASGGRFEGRRLRYLYFYPTYFFTPETLEIFRILQRRLSRVKFTELRRQLISEGVETSAIALDPATWQRIEPLMVTPEELFSEDEDRYLRMHFPDNEPVTFYFIGVPPPGRDAKDAESWVHPAFLSLILPLCVDVKVVASESQMPLLNEADELAETVLLDGPHAAISYIARQSRINQDQLLPTLNRLAVTYLIHMDSNSSTGSGGFDYRWQDLPSLARHLAESPLYAFWYLKKWQRSAKADAIPPSKARLYLEYYRQLAHAEESGEGVNMNHALELTKLYWRFYRAGYPLNSNRILRPLAVAAKTVMNADRRVFNEDGLATAVRGELFNFVERVNQSRADGFIPKIEVDGRKVVDNEAIQSFADYFVRTLFFGVLNGDLSALRGRQINLLKSACEVIYRDLDTQHWANRNSNESLEDANGSDT